MQQSRYAAELPENMVMETKQTQKNTVMEEMMEVMEAAAMVREVGVKRKRKVTVARRKREG